MCINSAFQAAPAIPTLLSVTALATPATDVPCSCPGDPVGSLSVSSSLAKFTPCTSSMNPLMSSSIRLPGISSSFVHTFERRSSCRHSPPSSTIAITTFGTPSELFTTSHASGNRINRSSVWSLNLRSFGSIRSQCTGPRVRFTGTGSA